MCLDCPDVIVDTYLDAVTAVYLMTKADRARTIRGEAPAQSRDDRGLDTKSVLWGRIDACLFLCPDLRAEDLLRVDARMVRAAAREDAAVEYDETRYQQWALRRALEDKQATA